MKYKARFSPVRQDLFSKFWCPVLSGEETNMPNHQPGRTRVWHHYESDTPTSSRAIYVLKSANANDIHNVFSIGGTGVQKAQKCAYVIYGWSLVMSLISLVLMATVPFFHAYFWMVVWSLRKRYCMEIAISFNPEEAAGVKQLQMVKIK